MPVLADIATLTPCRPHLGMEVAGLDVREIQACGLEEQVRHLLYDRGVLCFRGQTLSADDLLAFTRVYGEPEKPVQQQFTLPGYPNVYVLSNVTGEDGRPIGAMFDGFGWHSDLTYKVRPAAFTTLYGVECPPVGADTLFTSTAHAFATLPEPEKRRLRPLVARYSYREFHETRRDPNKKPLTPHQLADNPDTFHPVVRIHPETGRELIYIGLDDCTGIDGMSREESRALIDRLYTHVSTPDFVYAHKWQVGDLVIWDNRMMMHTATEYDTSRHRRTMYRTLVIGERPIGWNERDRVPAAAE